MKNGSYFLPRSQILALLKGNVELDVFVVENLVVLAVFLRVESVWDAVFSPVAVETLFALARTYFEKPHNSQNFYTKEKLPISIHAS